MQLWWRSETSSVISSYLEIHLVAMHLGRQRLYMCTPSPFNIAKDIVGSSPRLPRDYMRQPIGTCYLFPVPCFIGSATSSATNKVSTLDSIKDSIIVVTKCCKKNTFLFHVDRKEEIETSFEVWVVVVQKVILYHMCETIRDR